MSFVMRMILCGLLIVPLLAGAGAAVARPPAGQVRVRIVTSLGPIVIALDSKNAPQTTANFLAYVDDGRFDNTTFYRAARNKQNGTFGYVQGGTRTDLRRNLPPVAHEPTNMTGIRHLDATISMARGGPPGSAMGNFFITVGATPFMDAAPGNPGYAAFGHVVSGMDIVRRILAEPTGGGEGPMRGQMILRPITVTKVQRIDGVPKPTGRPQPWLLELPKKRKLR